VLHVASKPSLAEVEFDRLDDRVCFGVNGSIVKSVETGVPFAYHAITDRTFVQNRFDLVRQALDSGADCLLTFRVLSQIAERELVLLGCDCLFLPRSFATRSQSSRSSKAISRAPTESR
jgi:hypothetical protein